MKRVIKVVHCAKQQQQQQQQQQFCSGTLSNRFLAENLSAKTILAGRRWGQFTGSTLQKSTMKKTITTATTRKTTEK
jgi:hypothetical protein